MIPRYHIVLLVILLAASAVMGTELWRLRQQAHQRLLAGEVSTPTQAPEVAPEVQATLMVANDADSSLTPQVLSLPLPTSPNERARAILGKLLDIYAAPGASHPIPGGASGVSQVFLLPATAVAQPSPLASARPAVSGAAKAAGSGPELAVVDLTSAFANSQPSGLETESLTILSICDTLHVNLPRIAKIRFLVDGQPRATLAGHADLTRTYLTAAPVSADAGGAQ